MNIIETALLTLDAQYPYALDADNLVIEYRNLFDTDYTNHLTIEQMAKRIIRVLGD